MGAKFPYTQNKMTIAAAIVMPPGDFRAGYPH